MATKTFTGSINSNVSNAGNWSPSGCPLSTDDVVLNVSSPACIVDTITTWRSLVMTGFINTLTTNKMLNLYNTSGTSNIIFGSAMSFANTGVEGITLIGQFTINS